MARENKVYILLLYFSLIINSSSSLSTSSKPFLHLLPNGILVNTSASKMIITNVNTQARFYVSILAKGPLPQTPPNKVTHKLPTHARKEHDNPPIYTPERITCCGLLLRILEKPWGE